MGILDYRLDLVDFGDAYMFSSIGPLDSKCRLNILEQYFMVYVFLFAEQSSKMHQPTSDGQLGCRISASSVHNRPQI